MEIDAVILKNDLPGSKAGTYGCPHLDRWDFPTDDGGFHTFTTAGVVKGKSWFLIIPKLNPGDYVTILHKPRSWASECNDNNPFHLEYPRSGSISEISYDGDYNEIINVEITFPDGSYGFSLNSLFRDGIIRLEENVNYAIGCHYWDELAKSAVQVVSNNNYNANVGNVTLEFVKKNSWRFRRLATNDEMIHAASRESEKISNLYRVDKVYVSGVDPYADNKKTDVLLVRITGSRPSFWYNNLEGYLFFAYESGNFYHVLDYATVEMVNDSVRGIVIDTHTKTDYTIFKNDAEVVSKINL